MILTNNTKDLSTSKNEVEQVVREKKEYTMLGSYSISRGFKLFAYNSEANKIREVVIKVGEFIQCELVFTDNKLEWVWFDPENYNANIYIKDICFEALNLSLAEKRLKKFKEGKIKELFNLKKPRKNKINIWDTI